MKLQAEIDGVRRDVSIVRNGDAVTASVDGREYELEVSQPEPGVYLIKDKGRIDQISVAADRGSAGVFHTHSRSGDAVVKISDPKQLRGGAASDGHADGPVELKTAMPGKIVRVLLAAGEEVKKGDGVLVVEAMKMQNELKSPKDGTIKEIRFAEGDTVAAGETLATIE